MREKNSAKGEAQSLHPPSLESLEPRLLLSADCLCSELLAPLDNSLSEPAIYADLNQQEQGIQDDSSSVILTYLASSTDTEQAPVDAAASDPEDSQENLLEQPLTALLETVAVDVGPAGQLAATPLVQAELTIEITADVDDSTLLSDEQSACLAPVDRQDDVSDVEGFPIEIRGPPRDDGIVHFLTVYGAGQEEGNESPISMDQITGVSEETFALWQGKRKVRR